MYIIGYAVSLLVMDTKVTRMCPVTLDVSSFNECVVDGSLTECRYLDP